jgi:aminoglycoside phosphotransferase (APT) family kinase protein
VVGASITVDRVKAFLSDRYGDRVRTVEPLAGGDWSQAFAFRLDDGDFVVRFGSWPEDFEKDRIATAFTGTDLPVPRFVEMGEALGGLYAISERHFGLFLEELDEDRFRRVLPALLRALDAMWRLPAHPELRPLPWDAWLFDLLVDRPGGRVSGWRQKLARSPDLEALFVAGHEAMMHLLPACPDLQHVLHLDLLNRNVLVAEDATHLEAVFDWGCLVSGDFVYEVAWFTFWAPWHRGLSALDFRSSVLDHYASIGLTVEDFDQRLTCYELHIGLNHLAYNTFVSAREDDVARIADRLQQVLSARGSS